MTIQIIIYTFFYIIGVVLGSFFTLAIYRIPLKQDITHTRSYCPKCNNKLKFIDLIPILSYLFLGGKCRYCHEKISKRYIIIEFFSGLFYLLFVISLKIEFFNITIHNIEMLIFGTLMISVFFILGGIAKESKTISSQVLTFGVIVEIMHIIYLYVLKYNIYRYVIYLIFIFVIYIIKKYTDNSKIKNHADILITIIIGIIATNELVFLANIITITILLLFTKNIDKKSNFVYYYSFINILYLTIFNFITNYLILK